MKIRILLIAITFLFFTNCKKEVDELKISADQENISNFNWNRVSMKTNPTVVLPKQDGSGGNYEIFDLMDLKNLEGYERDFEGNYKFSTNGTYTVANKEIIILTSDGKTNVYKIIKNNKDSLVMNYSMIFYGQETTLRLACKSY